MVNKVGSYLLLLCLSCTLSAQIRLKLTDMNGAALKQAAIGVPFILEVRAPVSSKSIQSPSIKGIEALQPRQISFQLRSMGTGKSEVLYRYRVQATEAGSYTIGPLIAKTGEPIDDTSLTIIVSDQPITGQKNNKKPAMAEPFFRLTASKEYPMIGEKVVITGKFYFMNDTVTLRGVSEPQGTALSCISMNGPFQGVEEINETKYQCIEWQWECVFNKEGRIVVPASTADYEVAKEQQFQFGGFGRFFGTHIERLRTYSNALIFNVDALPPCDEEVTFIGSLQSIQASISPSIAKEGEGLILTLRFEGEGVESIKTPVLTNMPKELKYYESKSTVNASHVPNNQVKQFEYIVQGLEPGNWVIPPQRFTFFDTHKKAYQTVETQRLSTSIIAQAQAPVVVQKKEDTQLVSAPEKTSENKPNLLPYARSYNHIKMPWWLVTFLALLPVLYLVIVSVNRWFFGSYYHRTLARRAFSLARSKLKKQYPLSAQQIDVTLKECFANRFGASLNEITNEFMEIKVRDAGFSEKMCNEWTIFTTLLAAHAYGDQKERVGSLPDLVTKARTWIDQLEGQL